MTILLASKNDNDLTLLIGEAPSKYIVIAKLSSLSHILHIYFSFTNRQQLYCMECIVQPPEVVKTYVYISHIK